MFEQHVPSLLFASARGRFDARNASLSVETTGGTATAAALVVVLCAAAAAAFAARSAAFEACLGAATAVPGTGGSAWAELDGLTVDALLLLLPSVALFEVADGAGWLADCLAASCHLAYT